MYTRGADLYDELYSFKDYGQEASTVHKLIKQYKKSEGNKLLDVACGTGLHLEHFKLLYDCRGIDLSNELVALARKKHPGMHIDQGDMREFSLDEKFDVITCLFSAIGYMQTNEDLEKAVANMAKHLVPGGVLIVEPWLYPGEYQEGLPWALTVDKPDLKVVRMNVSQLKGRVSVLDFHFLKATKSGVDYFRETHELVLYSKEEYIDALRKAGLEPHHDEVGLMGRGLFIGVNPK